MDSCNELIAAAAEGNIEWMRRLLDAGANVDAVDECEETPCRIAVKRGHVDALRLLLERGAHITDDSSLLKYAALYSTDERIAILLLNNGAPTTSLNAMFLVATLKSVDVVRCMLVRNIELRALRDKFGGSLCHRVVLCAERDDDLDALVRELVGAGVGVNTANFYGRTALHFAAIHRNRSALRVLVELGADIERLSNGDQTVLHWLYSSNMDDDGPCAELLLALGADVRLANKVGRTACHFAAQNGLSAQLCAFVAAGGDLDQSNVQCETPRMLASLYGCKVPTDAEIDASRRRIAKTRLDFVRDRACVICVGLQPLDLNALQLCEILARSFSALGALIAFHQWWKIATTVKHFSRRSLKS
jgi:ankyrin repeat protein